MKEKTNKPQDYDEQSNDSQVSERNAPTKKLPASRKRRQRGPRMGLVVASSDVTLSDPELDENDTNNPALSDAPYTEDDDDELLDLDEHDTNTNSAAEPEHQAQIPVAAGTAYIDTLKDAVPLAHEHAAAHAPRAVSQEPLVDDDDEPTERRPAIARTPAKPQTPSISEHHAHQPNSPEIENNDAFDDDDGEAITEKTAIVKAAPFTAPIDTPQPDENVTEPEAEPEPVLDLATELESETELEREPVAQWHSIPLLPVTPPIVEPFPLLTPPRRRQLHTLLTFPSFILLAVISAFALMLWHDFSTSHLYVTSLNPRTGTLQSLQPVHDDQNTPSLTAPIISQQGVALGLQSTSTERDSESHIIFLQGSSTSSWQLQKTLSASLAHGTLSTAPNGDLLISSVDGLQVDTPTGDLLWQRSNPQPGRGLHPFQPVSDGHTLYTLSTSHSFQVGAYDLSTGTPRWTQHIDDSVEYAPPPVLYDKYLYIASDHTIYAFNSADGSLLWQKKLAARTLLLEQNGTHQLLITAGTNGVHALDLTTGTEVWAFASVSNSTITPAQCYQATLSTPSSTHPSVIYTTGVVWQMPQVQQQLWLYAVDARTGTQLWSQKIASGLLAADAGRLLMPALDSTQHLVILQQQLSTSAQLIHGFDAQTGKEQWNHLIEHISNASPTLLAASSDSLLLFTTTSDFTTLLLTPTLARLVLLLLTALATLCWLISCLLALPARLHWLQHALHAHSLKQHIQLRHFLLKQLPAIALITIIIGATSAYLWLKRPVDSVYHVTAASGATEWEKASAASSTIVGVDQQGSILVTATSANQHQLQALDNDGHLRWHLYETEGSYFLPAVPEKPGTLLVALSGQAPFHYQFAPDDPAYPRALDHLLVLSLLDRATGTPLWEHIVVYPDEQQSAHILGGDAHFIYLASTQTNPSSGGPTVQLVAINQLTSSIDWRVFGPTLATPTTADDGKLLVQSNQLIWQIAGTVYAIDTAVGQISWRTTLNTSSSALLQQEESEMVQSAGVVLVARNDVVHALDSSSGNELWTLPSTSLPDPHAFTALVSMGQTILLGTGKQLLAFDATSHRRLWHQSLNNPVSHLTATDDGKTVYATTSAALLAFDVPTGTTRWQFAPAEHFSLASILYRAGHVFISTCFPTANICAWAGLYTLDATTGNQVWNMLGSNATAFIVSTDGKTVGFGIQRRTWINLFPPL